MIEITNNLVELHVAQLIDMQMRQISWKYDYDSVAGGKNKHWHVFAGHDVEECNKNGFEFVEPIWNSIQKKYEVDMERVYFNAHTHGIEPHIHQDDGDVTSAHQWPATRASRSWSTVSSSSLMRSNRDLLAFRNLSVMPTGQSRTIFRPWRPLDTL